MNQEQMVSVWSGNFTDKKEFESYFELVYTEDGDVTSPFMQEFNIEYDEDFSEAVYEEVHKDYRNLLKDCSYAHSYRHHLPSLNKDMNTVMALYHFTYTGKQIEATQLQFIGAFPFESQE